jgi:hypothetical protein
MALLKDEAKAYEPPQTKNIADLDKVPVDVVVEDREYTRGDGEQFKIKVVAIDGEDYRVPISVIKSLKAVLEEKPDLKEFKVKRTGEGLKTEYTLIPLYV